MMTSGEDDWWKEKKKEMGKKSLKRETAFNCFFNFSIQPAVSTCNTAVFHFSF